MTDVPEDIARPSAAARFFRGLGRLIRWTIYLLGTIWAFGAISFDGPADPTANVVLATVWAIVTLTYFTFLRGAGKRFFAWAACMLVVLVPWLDIRPSNDREWAPEFARTGSATIEGDTVTLHNFRNFDYAPDGTVTERWENRTVHLSKLQGLDYIQDNFRGKLLAHPIFSFDFGEDGRIALSIETRREKDESFAVLPGFYKAFELQHIFGDERDLVRVRTNIRKEPVRIFHTKATPDHGREIFAAALESLNGLHKEPRFYNVISTNCTTGLRALNPAEKRVPWDYRILLNGRLHELLYEKGLLVTNDLSLEKLEGVSLITKAAQAAHDDPDFSNTIRRNLPQPAARAPAPANKPTKDPATEQDPAPSEE